MCLPSLSCPSLCPPSQHTNLPQAWGQAHTSARDVPRPPSGGRARPRPGARDTGGLWREGAGGLQAWNNMV